MEPVARPTSIRVFVHLDWRSRSIQTCSSHFQFRGVLVTPIITLVPPEKFLAKSRIPCSVVRQAVPNSVCRYVGPQLLVADPQNTLRRIRRRRYERSVRLRRILRSVFCGSATSSCGPTYLQTEFGTACRTTLQGILDFARNFSGGTRVMIGVTRTPLN